jgi:hypothetical protein
MYDTPPTPPDPVLQEASEIGSSRLPRLPSGPVIRAIPFTAITKATIDAIYCHK